MRYIISFIFILCLAFSLCCEKTEEKKTIEVRNSQSSFPQQDTPALLPSRAKQEKFVYNILLPTMENSAINYSIPSIRKKMAAFMGRLNSEQFLLNMSPIPAKQRALAGAHLNEQGYPTLTIFVPVMMEMYEESGDIETFIDRLISTLLHEEFHLVVQGTSAPGDVTDEELMQHESGAWIYTITEVAIPMLNSNRSYILRDYATAEALHAYQQANGDPNHPAWIEFAWSATGIR